MIDKLKKMSHTAVKKLRRLPRKSKLPIALGLAVCFAITTTVASVIVYTVDGSYRLDLSRPGFETEREEVKTTESQKTYDTTSPVTETTVTDFLTEYDTRIKDLSEYGDFRDEPLSNGTIQLFSN